MPLEACAEGAMLIVSVDSGAKGWLGVKTGRGFYPYGDKK